MLSANLSLGVPEYADDVIAIERKTCSPILRQERPHLRVFFR
jgi:hypothetical protein